MQKDYLRQLYAEFESMQSSGHATCSTRMSENLAYVIRKAILSGVLKQGMPIRERALAQELNVSRTPVREALFVLQGEGLVVLNHNRSACVAYFSSDDIRKIYSLRGVLESYSAECAAYRNDPEDLLKIRTALLKYQGLDARSAPIEQAQADLEFHEAICSAAGSRMLMTLTRQALAVTVTHRSRYAYTEEQLRHAQRQHETLYDAINAGNGKLAHLLMSQHVSQSSELAISHLSDAPNSSPEN